MKYESLIKSRPNRTESVFGRIRLNSVSDSYVNPAGFTLLELVTVIGIFSVISLLILAMHAEVSDLQKRTSDEQRAVSEIRYALETIANNLRIGTVNYKFYNNSAATGCRISSSSQSVLHLIDEDKEQSSYEFHIDKNAGGCSSTSVGGCIVKKYFGTGSTVLSPPAQITSPKLNIKDFKVYILPLCNPYSDPDKCTDTKRQPIVTMVAGVEIPEKGGGKSTRWVQTTVSSRVYQQLPEVCPRS